jgi:hypothetical protein
MDRKMRDRMANLPPTQSIKRKTEGDTEKVRPLLQISLYSYSWTGRKKASDR